MEVCPATALGFFGLPTVSGREAAEEVAFEAPPQSCCLPSDNDPIRYGREGVMRPVQQLTQFSNARSPWMRIAASVSHQSTMCQAFN